MLKTKITFFILFVLSLNAFGQTSSSSLYSRYKYGIESSESSFATQALGGTGIALRTANHTSFINPASNSAIKKETFIFELGAGYVYNKASQAQNTNHSHSAFLEYAAAGLPVIQGIWASSIGALPFSSVGYSIKNSSEHAELLYSASGGISQVAWGNSFTILKNFHIGFHARYLFGQTDYESIAIPTSSHTSYSTLKQQSKNTWGIIGDLGAQYVFNINDENALTIGATYRSKQSIKYYSTNFMASFTAPEVGANTYKDTLEYNIVRNLKTDIPAKIGVGLAYELKNKLSCGVDYSITDWNDVFVYGENNSNADLASSINVGVEYVPDFLSISYFKRLPYRIGFHFTELNTGADVNGTELATVDLGVSIGTDFRFKKTRNNLCVSLEYGRIGDLNTKNSITETYFKAKLAFSLNETWFFKRKID